MTPDASTLPRHRPVRSYHPRGRVSARHRDAMARLWRRYGIAVPPAPAPADPAAWFGRRAPLVLDIGFGMGEATAAMAAADPGRDYLAVEVHLPGIAHLLTLIEQDALGNVRVARGDALDLARHLLGPASLDAIHVFFPDPWPKLRHRKRRLIQPAQVALLSSRLAPGGTLHCASDCAGYAHAMLATLGADPQLVNAHHGNARGGFADRPAHRPCTRFEQRAREAGREVFDVVFHRRPAGPLR